MPEIDLDLKASANVQNPFALYRWLRDHDPVHRSESLSGWVVTRFADVLEIFNQPVEFSSDRFRKIDEKYASQRPVVKLVSDILAQWFVFRDPPDHDRMRGLLQKFFSPHEVEKNRALVQSTIDALLDLVRKRGEMEFIADVAFPLPAMVIATVLGAPTEDIEAIKTWSDRLAAFVGGSVDQRDNLREASAGLSHLVEYFHRLLRERERNPRDDLLSFMLQGEHEGLTLSRDEVVSNCTLLLFAGHETTTNLLGNGLFHLLRHPAQAAMLRDDPDLTPAAVEELLRYDCPVPGTVKIASKDMEWRGRSLRHGDMVIPFMASANRDERQFPDADTLDVRRAPGRHLAFAWGLHFCLGAWLARLEACVAFDTMLRRLPGLRLVSDQPTWKPMIFLRGLEALPLTWS